ncbi:ABC transporter transmembrane domain-containing protein [Actinomycetospora termitidis]|uniref:ABC transporter ATP-binding protein n=1 Tax=Actinomycetospora termitidis TaxID=3053470 RepID=A0ABT7MIV7_9PSEU|nr:ABC transporter ATP-binding protein [Actinomycetospora sp. Odt1-22]MDL5160611.1 ABC transporter ATP-binding protein [Actinomycetospora sp. Odt1-22]
MRLDDPPSATGLLLALLRARPWLALASVVAGTLWLVPGALVPLVAGDAVDAGIAGGDTTALLRGAGLVVALGLAQMVFGGAVDFLSHGLWLHAASSTQRHLTTHVLGLGASLSPQVSSGDVTAVTTSDLNKIGNLFETAGRFAGSVVAFGVVGVGLLARSPLLGTVALVGVPLAVVGIGPLLRPLQRRRDRQRTELAAVNALAADIVAGLRILRGVGGETRFAGRFAEATGRVRAAGLDVARSTASLGAAEVLLPGLVLVTITWLGARLAVSGAITAGELVAVYGASAFLVVPVTTATEAAASLASARAGAKKVARLLALRALLTDPGERAAPLPAGALGLADPVTGLDARPGELTVVDAGPHASALAARLARFAEGGRVDDRPSDTVGLAEMRRRVVHAGPEDLWFSGPLRAELVASGSLSVDVALDAAAATEILDGFPHGLDEPLGERGREVSGGQRQRLALARALLTDADVLVLEEPTSAVDAHTEAWIAARVAHRRRGRTTVVLAQSAPWRHVADRVVDLTDTRTLQGSTSS